MQEHGESTMPLYRKVRRAGGSAAIVIPADFAKAMGLEIGTTVEIVPVDRETIAVRRAKEAGT